MGSHAKKANFAAEAMSMSQEKDESGGKSATTVVIVGGGPAAMICALALCSIGFNARVCEQQPEFNYSYPGPDDDKGTAELLSFSTQSVKQLQKWGLKRGGGKGEPEHPDLGEYARTIPYRDIRSLSGRLIRREPCEGICIRAQDLCRRIRDVIPPPQLQVFYNSKVLGFVDITWGAAVYLDQGKKLAGDLLIGADGADSIVRKHVLEPGISDMAQSSGMTQWQGSVPDESEMYKFFGDAVHMYLGSESFALVHRLPQRVVQWSVMRPSRLDAANALNEWRAMIKEWPVSPDGHVEIPAEYNMKLRESFDLFDADHSGSLDKEEVKTAMRTVGLELSEYELQKIMSTVDQDNSGTFSFAEFIEVVKILLQKMRLAEASAGLIEEMADLSVELQEGIKSRQKDIKIAEKRVYEMRKGGAVGQLALEATMERMAEEVVEMREQLKRCNEKALSASQRLEMKAKEEQMEYDQAKDALGRWLRTSNSHDIFRRLILETTTPQRKAVTNKTPLKRWSLGRITLAGNAAHPSSPVAMTGADECVMDAQKILESFEGLSLPDDIPIALQKYSNSRIGGSAHSQQVSLQLGETYASPGIDWDKIMDEELSSIIDVPMHPFIPFAGC